VARYGLVTTCAVVALAATACSLPQAPAREVRTNAEALHGEPVPTQAPPVTGAPTIDAVAKVEPLWVNGSFTAKAGVVNISFTSPVHSNHNLNLVGPHAPYPLVWGVDAGAPADHLTYAVTLFKGKYTFYCSVPGHRAAGMEGQIVVS
jgi:plastocyanin